MWPSCRFVDGGVLTSAEGPFATSAASLVKNSVELVTDADQLLKDLLSYRLEVRGSRAWLSGDEAHA